MIFEDLLRNPLHLLMLFLVATMIFGTSKLADAGKNLGRGIKEFKKEMRADDETQPATPGASVAAATTVAALTGHACHSCGAALPTGARFCLECGTAVTVEAKAAGCPTCHAAVAPNAKFCNECGTPVGLVPA